MDVQEILSQLILAGAKTRELSKDMFESIKVGADASKIVQVPDRTIFGLKKEGYELLCPTTIDLNNFVNNCVPMHRYALAEDDVVSYCISLSKKIPGMDGYAQVKAAYTKVFSPVYEKISTIAAEACNAGLKECGVDVPLTEPRHAIYEVLQSADLYTISNICGHEMYNSHKIVPNGERIPDILRQAYDLVNGRMRENEVYFIDVYATDTSADVEAVQFQFPSIYYGLENKRTPHRKSTAKAHEIIKKEYKGNVFSLWDFRERFEAKATIKLNKSIMEDLNKQQLIFPIASAIINNEMKDISNVVARFGHSIHIGAEKNTFLC